MLGFEGWSHLFCGRHPRMPWKDPAHRKKYDASAARVAWKAAWRKKYNVQRRAAKRAFLIEAKAKPCMDCGVSYPHYVMDLDHVRGTKVAGLADLLQHGTLDQVVEEIAKCELVCSNCHRIRTWNRAGWGDAAAE